MRLTNMNRKSRASILSNQRPWDFSIISGIGGALLLLLIVSAWGGNITRYLDLGSFVLVILGSIALTLANFSFLDLKETVRAISEVLFVPERKLQERLEQILTLAIRLRREGVLVLEETALRTDDPFFARALSLAVDGRELAETNRILEKELTSQAELESRAVEVLEGMAGYAPALGLIGTLLGLVQLLGSLSDSSAVAQGMSVALMTTLYGAVLANIICLPLAGKLKFRAARDGKLREMTLEGVSALIKKESPILLEERLKGFITSDRLAHGQ